jgi:hypothetical protein
MSDEEGDSIRVERSRQWLNGFAARYLDPPLRERGFRRQGRNWNRRTDEVVHVLHIQAGRYGPGIQAGMGVFVPAFHRFIRDEPVPKFISEYLCQLQAALGHWGSGLRFEQLDPDNSGRQVVHIEPPTINPRDVLDALLEGVAVLDEVDTVEVVREILTGPTEKSRLASAASYECLAVLAAQSGDVAGARQLLLSAIDKIPASVLSTRTRYYEAIAQRLGVTL